MNEASRPPDEIIEAASTLHSSHVTLPRAPIAAIKEILEQNHTALGRDFAAYHHHCHRVFHFCRTFPEVTQADEEKIATVAAFHDLGIWKFGTFDYLAGSSSLARSYLSGSGQENWAEEIEAMIANHHKLTPYRGPLARLVEAFRKADWTDVSLGYLRFGLPKELVARTQAAFPNLGFHTRLAGLTLQRLRSHPLSPLPMMKI